MRREEGGGRKGNGGCTSSPSLRDRSCSWAVASCRRHPFALVRTYPRQFTLVRGRVVPLCIRFALVCSRVAPVRACAWSCRACPRYALLRRTRPCLFTRVHSRVTP